MRLKTSELIGAQLDLAVGEAQGLAVIESFGPLWRSEFAPSIRWAQGGEIIEREGISIEYTGWGGNEGWIANHDHETDWQGHTPLVAAMRCYVASKLGEEVELSEFNNV